MKTILIIFVMKSFFGLQVEKADIKLSQRQGEKPKTVYAVPHKQISQESSNELFMLLENWLFTLPHIEKKQAIASFPSAVGASISKNYKGSIKTLAGREWTHIHKETGYGSMHALLTGPNAFEVIEKGWGELHPLNRNATKNSAEAIVMIYSPRNTTDLEQIKKILISSYNYTLGANITLNN